MATRSKKPKCDGSTSQSCGMGCISREHTCRELIAAAVATRLLAVAKQHQQPNDASGQSFDTVANNFPASVLKAAHKTGVATSDLGNGATLTTKVATGLDGSSIKYGFVTDADGKRYTVSDGLVKEVTSAVGSEWGEAFDAAVRSKIAVQMSGADVGSTKTPTFTGASTVETFDPTKLLTLDYLNDPIGESHVKEIKLALGFDTDIDELNNIVESAVKYSNGGKYNVQNWARSQDGGVGFTKWLDSPDTKYIGQVYRGESYGSSDEASQAIERLKAGTNPLQSWSKAKQVAEGFMGSKGIQVLYVDSSNTATDIEKFTQAYHLEYTEEAESREPGASEQEVVSKPGRKAKSLTVDKSNPKQWLVNLN